MLSPDAANPYLLNEWVDIESLKLVGAMARDHVIVRIWHGRVPKDKAEAYRDFLVKRAVPDYESVEGNLGVEILMKENGDAVDFLILSYWESIDAIRKFAGEDYEKAKYYDEDRDFLLEFEPKVQHYYLVWSSRKFE
ncbi:MAG: antibiotic biosynthesis monooxygenase [Desulfurococcales archaeon]|nr:antibiotic biosynthesis monooxygenase [Desulfurococcales archaeon]